MKYKIGDTVLYATIGVCRITDIRTQSFNHEDKNYYVLSPVFDERSTCYIPVDFNTEKVIIQPILTVPQAKRLLQFIKEAPELEWINDPNERKQQFNQIHKYGNREEKIRLIKSILHFEKSQKSIGKQLPNSDSRILKECENDVLNELAFVLDTTLEELKKSF